MRVDQFTPSIAPGDGVSRGVLLTARLLGELGFDTRIFARHIAAELEGVCRPVAELDAREPPDTLIVHHAIGHEDHARLLRLPVRRILAYHNVTPEFYFRDPLLREACALGRRQLAEAIPHCSAWYADSTYNTRELHRLGATRAETLPLLYATDAGADAFAQASGPPTALSPRPRVLFVGRVTPNKCQHQLVRLCAHFRHVLGRPFELSLAGGTSDPGYAERVQRIARRLGVDADVQFLGRVSEAELEASYARAEVFLSLSEHEGFCIPAVEATARGVPVLAYAAGGLETAIGPAGLLRGKALHHLTPALAALFDQPRLRTVLQRAQRDHIRRFEYARLRAALGAFLARRGVPGPGAR